MATSEPLVVCDRDLRPHPLDRNTPCINPRPAAPPSGEPRSIPWIVGFLRSAIRSGEQLSPADDAMIDAALLAFLTPVAPTPSTEERLREEVAAAIARAEKEEARKERAEAGIKLVTARAEKAEAEVARLREENARLVDGIRATVKRCAGCRGKGQRETTCSMCHDSTWDHECDSKMVPCDECAPLRALLPATAPPASPASAAPPAKGAPNVARVSGSGSDDSRPVAADQTAGQVAPPATGADEAAFHEALMLALRAADDLCFECDGVLATRAPSRATYNRAFYAIKAALALAVAVPVDIAAIRAEAANDALESAAVIAEECFNRIIANRIRALKTASGAAGQPPAAQTKSDPPKKAFDPNDVDFGDTE